MPEQPKESKLKAEVSFYHTTVNKYRIRTITMFQEDGKNYLKIFRSLLFSAPNAKLTCARVFG